MHLLVPYVSLLNHPDPLFEEYTYGEGGARGKKLKNHANKGDYIFFHTSKRNQKYITAYYIVKRVIDTVDAINDRNIVSKYNNPHMLEMIAGKIPKNSVDVILFGDPILSRKLNIPLPFNKTLSKKLSLNIRFPVGKTETQVIGSATRAWRELTDIDVDILQNEINKLDNAATPIKRLLSSEEVSDIVEKHIEDVIAQQPSLIEKNLKLEGRQVATDEGRIDLLFKDINGNKIVVELKLGKIGRKAVKQIKRYIKWVEQNTPEKVHGIIVCEGVMPAFEDDLKKIKDIKIYCYGWQLNIIPWSKMR